MTVERYLEAANRENTQRSYASALRHFEVEWGGHLPATPDSVARYLADHAGELSATRFGTGLRPWQAGTTNTALSIRPGLRWCARCSKAYRPCIRR